MRATINYSESDLRAYGAILRLMTNNLPTEEIQRLDDVITAHHDDEIDITEFVQHDKDVQLGIGLLALGVLIKKYPNEQ